MLKRTWHLLLVVSFLSGCGHLRNVAHLAVVEPPTPIEKDTLRWEILKTSPAIIHDVTSNAGARPPVLNQVDEDHTELSTQLISALNYSLVDDFEIGFVGIGLQGVQARGLLWQSDSSATDGAHFIGINTNLLRSEVRRDDLAESIGAAGNPWKAKATSFSRNLGISYGYRMSDDRLFYLGLAYNHFENGNHIEHFLGSNGTSPAAEYKLDSSGYSRSLSTGILLGKETQFKLGGTINQASWENRKKTDTYFDLSVTTRFDGFFWGPPKAYDLTPKNPWRPSDFGGVALAYLVGYGSGQAIQGNWKEKGYIFAAVDVTSTVSLLQGFRRLDDSSEISAALLALAISRVWQVVDVVIEASSSNYRRVKLAERQE